MEETDEERRDRLAKDAAAQRARRAKNPERYRLRDKAYRERTRERTRQIKREWAATNPDKVREQRRKWQAANRDKVKEYVLKATYGLTLDQYDTILKKQGGVCAICKQPPTTKVLNVDHSHVTGKVRGLLCSACNTAIGYLRDSVERAVSAAKYLKKHKEK